MSKPTLFSAYCLVLLGGLALLSRFDILDVAFVWRFWGGERATLEHLLSGLAAPSLVFLIFNAFLSLIDDLAEYRAPRNGWFSRKPGLIVTRTLHCMTCFFNIVFSFICQVLMLFSVIQHPSDFTKWCSSRGIVLVSAFYYIVYCFAWEREQYTVRDILQTTQLFADIAGVALWYFLMCHMEDSDPSGGVKRSTVNNGRWVTKPLV